MKKFYILLLAGLFSYNTSSAQLTVGSLLILKESADNLMSELGNLVDRQRQQTFIDLYALVTYSFDRLDGLLDDVDRKLTQREKSFYAQLDKLLFDANKAIEEQRIELFDELDKSIGQAIADLPFTKNAPYPIKIKTPFIGENSTGDFTVSVSGVMLNNLNNYAEINGQKSTKTYVISKNENQFTLPINQSQLKVGSKNVIKFVLHKNKRKKYEFEIPFWVFPKEFATVAFHYTYTKDVLTTSKQEAIKEMRSANSCGWTHNSSNISRVNEGNWKIDVNSITVHETGQAPGGGDCSIEGKSSGAFGTKVTARSDCRGLKRLNPDRGVTTCKYKWTETLLTPTEFSDSTTVSLSYNDSKVLADFPNGITTFKKVTIKYYNGQTFEFMDNAFDNGFISYYYDGVRQQFSIKSAFMGFSSEL